MASQVTLELAHESKKPLIADLMAKYLKELSQFVDGADSGSGDFFYPYLDFYWIEEERQPFLILAGAEVAGFALVRQFDSNTFQLAEFYIVPDFRRRKLGEQAASQLFRRFRGRWQVAQEEANVTAQAFWRNVIDRFTQGDFVEGRSEQPVGPCQEFSSISR